MPVWSLVVTNFASNFAFYTFLTFLPEYFEMMLGYDFESTGFLAETPYLTQLVGALVSGFLADKLAHGGHSLVLIRMAFSVIALLTPAILPFISDRTACVIIYSITIGFSGFIDGGCAENHLDIAPRHVGILQRLGNILEPSQAFSAPSYQATYWIRGAA
jgi:MFS family permease